MMDYRYNDKIETDIDKNVLVPIVVLCTRSGRKIGVINNIQEFRCSHPLNDVSEISFDVYKEVNGIKNIYWDFIKDFKFIFLPSVKDPRYKWYEITVNIDESNDTIKHITGLHANEAELGQLELYNIEINTENDIARDDYEIITIDGKEYGTVFYNPEHPKASLLHRLLSDKASHYSIVHVDETLKNLQREFSFNGTSIVDALNQTIAPEIGCLFIFGESDNNIDDNIFHRTISAYDLMDYCEDCGKRGNYTHGVCTNCGSTNIQNGYGEDTGIFINAENLTDSISFTSNTDQVKNFFKMGAGDEYMEAAIRNCNPNGSNYLFYFSDEMKEDMSDELVTKLNQYETIYDGYLKDYSIYLPDEDINKYNILVNKYQNYIKEDIPVMNNPIQGYAELTNYDYNAVNFKDCLQTTMMPSSPDVAETTADEQIAKLTLEHMSPIGTEDSSAMSLTAANTAVESYAKVYIDTSRYKIEITDSTYENNIWTGTITVTSLTDNEDTANTTLTIIFNNDGAQFLKQKIQKMMEEHKVEDIGDVSFLQEDYTDEELETVFKPKLQKYSLDALSLLDDLCSATMDILADANQGTVDSPYYEQFYHPYWKKRKLIMEEETVREEEIKTVEQVIEDIDVVRQDIINTLDMHNFFGEELYSELMLYRRETEYSNSNFISDGLADSEVIGRAQDYFKKAQEEIIKASTIQHSISCSLYNLFLLPEFRKILVSDDSSQIQYIGEGLYVDGNGEVHNVGDEAYFVDSTLKRFINLFDGGNWLRVRVDDKVYKLRLTNWEIDYTKPEELEVEFSDVIYSGDTMSDIASLLSQARTMATSYNTVMRQAEKGVVANKTIEQQKKQGLILNQNKIINDVNTQNFVLNSQGALMRAKNDFDDEYSPEQIKLLNKGIYYTNDDWETVKAGLGHFMYYDPETKTTKEDYGIIASTIVGQLLLGENLKIFSESGKFEMGDDGLKVTAIDGEDNTDLFVVQKQKVDDQGRPYVEKYIYVDSDGDVKIAGNSITIGTKPLTEYIEDEVDEVVGDQIDDARKVATNYLSADLTGIMVADMEYGEQTPSTATGKNVFIDNDSVDVRNGQTVLSSFGNNAIIIGQYGKSRLMLSPTMISGISDIGYKNFNIISGDSSEEETTITKSGNFENESSETGVFHGSINFSEKFYYFHKVTATVVFNYIWDGEQQTTDPLTLDIDDPEDETGNIWFIGGSVVNSSYVLEYRITCSTQHNGEMTYVYFDTDAQLTPKNTSIPVSYEIESTAPYSIVIETKVYKNTSYTFGSRVRNSEQGNNSFTIGEQLIASSDNQIAIGTLNNDDPNKNYAFMIGNGIYDENHREHRSNAFAVDCDGNVENMGDLEVGESLIVDGSADNIPNITINKESTNTTDYIKCLDANLDAKFRVLNDGGVIIGNDLLVGNSQTVTNNLTVGALDCNGVSKFTGKMTYNGSGGLFFVKSCVYNNTSIAANGTWYHTDQTTITITNYKAIAIAGFGVWDDGGYCDVIKCYIWNEDNKDVLDIGVKNRKNAAVTVNVYVKIFYIARNVCPQ